MNRCLLMNGSSACRRFSATAKICNKHFSFSFFVSILFSIAGVLSANNMLAQSSSPGQQKETYQKTIFERAAKIVNTLSITDSAKYKKVQSIIANQYFALADLQDRYAAETANIKKQLPEQDKQLAAVKPLEEKKAAVVMQLHNNFIGQLNDNLNAGQVEKVKDGMTYNVMPLTYAAYLEEVPTLTSEQKAKIYDWLKEARELAIDGESSDKKHAVFGKYKGRINNYLSAAGYDMKKEGEEWARRRQAAKDAKQTQN
jgi:hypothetical protein